MNRIWRRYKPFISTGIQGLITYRVDFILYRIGDVIGAFVAFYLWKAVFDSSSQSLIQGFQLSDMILYIIMSFVTNLLTRTDSSFMIGDEVKDGSIIMRLLRPVHFAASYLFMEIGSRWLIFLSIGVPFLLVITGVRLFLGTDLIQAIVLVVFYIISIILAFLINFFFNICFGFSAFVFKNLWGSNLLKNSLVAFMSGSLIPLTFFPKIVADILGFLPFSSLIYTPVMIIIGKYDGSQIVQALLLQIFWLIVMVALSQLIWKKYSCISLSKEVEMTKYQRMHFIFIKQYMKQIMEYKIDFFVGVLGVFLTQGLNLLFLNVLFQHIPSLEGWTFQQIAFIYGFSLLPKGIDHLFFDNLWALGQRLIRKGEFDKYLTRPISPLFHVLVETFQVDALGELLVGFILLSTTVSSISWTVPKVLLFIFIIPFATLIYTSLKIATSSIAFWTKQSGAVIYIFYMFNDFAKYPVAIYNNLLRWIISFVIPFAFTAYYPAAYFLQDRNVYFNIGGVILISLISFMVSLILWHKGVEVYESAGS